MMFNLLSSSSGAAAQSASEMTREVVQNNPGIAPALLMLVFALFIFFIGVNNE